VTIYINVFVYTNIYTYVNKNLVDILKIGNKWQASWGTQRPANRQAIFKANERFFIELTFSDTDEAWHRGGESWNGHGKGLREDLAERLY
jgi:hypothetical protein